MKDIHSGVIIKAVLGLLLPVSYYVMYLPVWGGHAFKSTGMGLFELVQAAALLSALVNLYFLLIRRRVIRQTLFNLSVVISAALLGFAGIFFVEGLMGIPPFPPQH